MFELVSSSKNYLTDSLYHRYYLASYENVCGNKVVLSENYLSCGKTEEREIKTITISLLFYTVGARNTSRKWRIYMHIIRNFFS